MLIPRSLLLRQEELKKQIEAARTTTTSGGASTNPAKELADVETRIAEITARQKELGTTLTNTLVDGQEHFERLGRLAFAAFNVGLGSGKSFMDMIKELSPALENLSRAQREQGYTANDAFQHILKIADFAKNNPGLASAADGINKMLEGLYNSAYLTPQALIDLGAEAKHIFDQLTSAGLGASDAFAIMQPTLQTLWELGKRTGTTFDTGTQSLIDQAEAAGVVGDAFRDSADRMVDRMDTLIGKFDELLVGLGIKIPDASKTAADTVAAQAPTFTSAWLAGISQIEGAWKRFVAFSAGPPSTTAPPSTPSLWSQITNPTATTPNNYFATGAYVTGPTAAWIGEGRDNEFVTPEPMMRKVMLDAVQAGAGGGGDTYHVRPVIYAWDARGVDRAADRVTKRVVENITRYNRGGAKTRLRNGTRK